MYVQVFLVVCLTNVAIGRVFDKELIARLQQSGNMNRNASVVPDNERYKLMENLQDWIASLNTKLLNMPRDYDILVLMDIRLSYYLSTTGIVNLGDYKACKKLFVDLPQLHAKNGDVKFSGTATKLLDSAEFEQHGTSLPTLANFAIEAFLKTSINPFTTEILSAALEVQVYSIRGSIDKADLGVVAAFYISGKNIVQIKFE